jgi:hypothetical protein
MKTELEKWQLELIDRELRAAKIEMRLYCWIVMPIALIVVIGMICVMVK